MSLVVALADRGRVQICGDLRIIKSDILPLGQAAHSPNYFNGVLKIIPVSPSVAICYAGTVSIALEAIGEVKASGCGAAAMPSLLISALMQRNSLSECDFLVIDAEELTIRKVQEGMVTSTNNGLEWIGDEAAFELLKRELDNDGFSQDENPIAKAAKIINGLQAVIEDGSIKNVGEFPLTAHGTNGEIQLGVAFSAQGPPATPITNNSPIQFSTDTNTDSLIINLTVPVERGIAAVGVYIAQAHRGALYMPLEQDEPFLVDGSTIGEFRRNVQEKYGIELLGGGFE
ncbi:MAG: hypothetical protein JWO35_224 [Candidatus Saccharibacteria bacterium]|nr:hypothetical protein [Candidatus Saccharibacteria bacterium]